MPGWTATPRRAQGPDPNGVPGHTGSAPMLGASSAAESKGALPGRGCPHATSTHSITARSSQGELHHLCLYVDSASFPLTPPCPALPQHRSQENVFVLEAPAPTLPARMGRAAHTRLFSATSPKHPSANTHLLPCM